MNRIYQNRSFWSCLIFFCCLILFVSSFIFKPSLLNNASLSHRSVAFEKELHLYENDASNLIKSTALIQRLAGGNETKQDLEYLYQKPYNFFIYKKAGNSQYLRFWNSSLVMVPETILQNGKLEQLVKLDNGSYLVKKLNYVNDTTINLYAVILIQSHFNVESDYFKESFPLYPGLDNLADISIVPTSYPIKSVSGKTTFYLSQKAGINANNDSVLFVIVRLVSFFLLFLSLYIILFQQFVRRHKNWDIPIFVGCMLLFRIILYICTGVFRLDSLGLFNPSLYNAGFLLQSLGDLLINSLLFCWIGVFIWSRRNAENIIKPERFGKRLKLFVGVLCVALLLILTFRVVNVIRSIVSSSQISFDVTNFFSLSMYTAAGLIILAFLSFGFHYFSRAIYHYLFPAFQGKYHWIYLLITIGGLSYVAIASPSSANLYLLCILWLLLYTLLFNNELSLNKVIRFNVSGTVVWVFVFSISVSVLMLSEIEKAELAQRKVYLQKQDTKSDPATERLIVMANTYLDLDFFRDNFSRLYNPDQNKFLRDSILSHNYSRYIKDYSASLYFFDSTNTPLFNSGNLSYESINTIITRQSITTNFADLYFYEPSYDKFAYITYRQIDGENGQHLGTVCIISQPKKFSPVKISPELFRQYKDWEFSNSPVYNYAIYSKKRLVASSKKYPFTSTLDAAQIPKKTFELRNNGYYSELWYKANNDKVIVMTRKSERVLEAITLFSYIFCAFLFLVALIRLASYLLNVIINKPVFKRRWHFAATIRGQIHNTFILITLLSFFVIGIATISFFIQRFEDSNADHLGKTMNIMLNEMQSHNDISTLVYEQQSDSMQSQKLEAIIKRVADIHGVDVNIFNVRGSLLATSQPTLYQKGVLSEQIDPRAYYYLFKLRHIEHTQKEKVSYLKYTNMYAPLRSMDGTFYAYLSIPYFTSEQVLNEEISRFLVTLINLNAFIFLITGLVALFITNRITHSFSLIKDKLMRINLSKNNEMIVWERNDEIGSLVVEYNKMVVKLRESADSLAKSERQEAWREMARQVTHEIKNPLTPMKLSLQYLQKAIDKDSPNIQQLTLNVSKTLVEQIDHLSKIAADFSQFANINQVKTEIFDLHEVIQPLVVIYSKNPEAEVKWHPLSQEVNVLADKTQMNRVFTNLLGNAIEAARQDTLCKIVLTEKVENGIVTISVADNGIGIVEDMWEKIFIPNFTTKSSGTGLGLAMCKTIIERAGGKIYFETVIDEGTTFSIELPIII